MSIKEPLKRTFQRPFIKFVCFFFEMLFDGKESYDYNISNIDSTTVEISFSEDGSLKGRIPSSGERGKMANLRIKAPFFEIGPKSYLYGDDVLKLAIAASIVAATITAAAVFFNTFFNILTPLPVKNIMP